jgi:hypothetical protein
VAELATPVIERHIFRDTRREVGKWDVRLAVDARFGEDDAVAVLCVRRDRDRAVAPGEDDIVPVRQDFLGLEVPGP